MRQLIKADGTTVDLPARPHSQDEIEKLIGVSMLDTVSRVVDGEHVMFVDDVGHFKNLPVNAQGTAYYHARCRPGTNPPTIVGDVVVVPMADFGD